MRAHVVPMSCEVNLWKNEASRLECTRTAYPRHTPSAGAELVLPSHVLLQVRLRDRRLRTPHATKTFQIFLTNAFAHNDRHERIGGSGRTWTLATAASKSRMVTGISIWSCHHRHHASANSDERTPRPQQIRHCGREPAREHGSRRVFCRRSHGASPSWRRPGRCW